MRQFDKYLDMTQGIWRIYSLKILVYHLAKNAFMKYVGSQKGIGIIGKNLQTLYQIFFLNVNHINPHIYMILMMMC